MLSVEDKGAGSSKVRNMTCAREDNCFISKTTHTKMRLVRVSHAREKFARVRLARCGVLFTLPVAYKGIVISCWRNSL